MSNEAIGVTVEEIPYPPPRGVVGFIMEFSDKQLIFNDLWHGFNELEIITPAIRKHVIEGTRESFSDSCAQQFIATYKQTLVPEHGHAPYRLMWNAILKQFYLLRTVVVESVATIDMFCLACLRYLDCANTIPKQFIDASVDSNPHALRDAIHTMGLSQKNVLSILEEMPVSVIRSIAHRNIVPSMEQNSAVIVKRAMKFAMRHEIRGLLMLDAMRNCLLANGICWKDIVHPNTSRTT